MHRSENKKGRADDNTKVEWKTVRMLHDRQFLERRRDCECK